MSNRFSALLPLFTVHLCFSLAAGCSSESTPSKPDASSTADASAAADAAADATPEVDAAPPEMLGGIAGDTCAAGCAALGKTCVAACTEHRSCGGHDGVAPPYAGYACYYWENEEGTFRTNDGRSLTSCDEEATLTWNDFGKIHTLGDYLGGNPVSCCCQ